MIQNKFLRYIVSGLGILLCASFMLKPKFMVFLKKNPQITKRITAFNIYK